MLAPCAGRIDRITAFSLPGVASRTRNAPLNFRSFRAADRYVVMVAGDLPLVDQCKVLVDKSRDPRVQRDLTGHPRRPPILQRLHQRILGKPAVLITGRPHALNNPGNTVRVPEPSARQPDTVTDLCAGDLSVCPDAQRRPTRHHDPA